MQRLDRHLSTLLDIKRSDVRLLLAQGRVEVDGITTTDINQVITRFSDVRCDGRINYILSGGWISIPPGQSRELTPAELEMLSRR